MTRIAHGSPLLSNSRGESPCSGLSIADRLMRVARSVWPRKTAAELALITGRSERMCRYWLSRRFDLAADDLSRLLNSEQGLDFLDELMRGAAPLWWAEFKTLQELSVLRRHHAATRSRLESLERVLSAPVEGRST